MSSSSLEGAYFGNADDTAIELEDYPEPGREARRQPADGREARRKEKRERKLQRLVQEAEDMKFSHSIQFNAVPDWSNHYISYSNLKKL